MVDLDRGKLPAGAPRAGLTLAQTNESEVSMSESAGIFSDINRERREEIVELLKAAYWMEIETVMSYIANSVNPEGVRAREIVDSLNADIAEELAHAQRFAARIKELYGVVPGSEDFEATQSFLQPPADNRDIVVVIKGVIEAERGALAHYQKLIELTDGVDPVTQDMVIQIVADEQGHLRMFEGFLREYEAG
jgi:bacterioferritin